MKVSTLNFFLFCGIILTDSTFFVQAGNEIDEFDNIPIGHKTSSSINRVVKDSEILVNDVEEQTIDDFSEESVGTNNRKKKTLLEILYISGDISGRNTFFVEFSFICFLILYIWNYFYGKISNRMIAIKWINSNKTLFIDQFALVSSASNLDPNPDELLAQDKGSDQFKFYSSGRKHCQALLAEILLIKRYDIFRRIVDALAYPYYDKVTIKIALTTNNENVGSVAGTNLHSFLFFLCRKGKQVSYREENVIFDEFTSQVLLNASTTGSGSSVPVAANVGGDVSQSKSSVLSSDLVFFSEVNDGIFDKLFSVQDVQILNELSDFVEFIGVTDFNVAPFDGLAVIPKKVLTCTFRLPTPASMDKVVPLTELCLRLVDTLYSFRLSLASKNKVDRNRKLISDRIEKVLMDRRLQEEREENEKKKIEKEMKDKEIYDKLPTALKLKKDLKEEKKKKKEENKNLMKVVKK